MTSHSRISRPNFATTMQVVEIAADIWGIEVHRLIRRERTRSISYPRFAVVWVLRQMGATLWDIANRLHFEDHSSVRHALARAEEMRESDPEFRLRCAVLLANANDLIAPAQAA